MITSVIQSGGLRRTLRPHNEKERSIFGRANVLLMIMRTIQTQTSNKSSMVETSTFRRISLHVALRNPDIAVASLSDNDNTYTTSENPMYEGTNIIRQFSRTARLH
jgi:hypothetical protein